MDVEEKKKSRHVRSLERKKERNEEKKMRRKLRKREFKEKEKAHQASAEAKVLKLQKDILLLKKSLQASKTRKRSIDSFRMSAYNSIRSLMKDRHTGILKKYSNITLSSLDEREIQEFEVIGQGVFGIVNKCYIKSMRLKVAVKSFQESYEGSLIMAEALVYQKLSGHPNFPFFYGILNNRKIVLEYIYASVTLRKYLEMRHKACNIYKIGTSIIRGVHYLHMQGLLHNDLHCGNILVTNQDDVKVIDFGKCSTVEEPVVYNIKPGSKRQEKYNKIHQHLAYELRNIPGSMVSFETDVYSIGYMFRKLSLIFNDMNLHQVATSMLSESPRDRPDLSSILFKVQISIPP